MALPLAKAELIGTLLEAICCGMYYAISFELFRILYFRIRAGQRTALLFFVTAMIMFVLININALLQISHVIEGFAEHMDVANDPEIYFETRVNVKGRRAKVSLDIILILVCDALFVYRVFVVYERKHVWIIIPSMLYLADVALSAWSVWVDTAVNSEIMSVKRAHQQIENFYAVTLALNLLCTVMISLKIWVTYKSGPTVAGFRFMGIVMVIIESAAVYSCVLVAIIVESSLVSTGLWIIFNPSSPIIGIIFSAVMVRASREYRPVTVDVSLPTDHTTYTDQQDTIPRNAGEISVGRTVQVPSTAIKRSSFAFHIPTSSHQVSRVDVIETGYRTSEPGI